MVARNIARYGIYAKAENVLNTSGSQQAPDLIGKLLINRGDRILVEAPNVIYLSIFSKTLAPGIRLAWIFAAED